MDLAKVAEAFSRARRLPAGERETVLSGLDPAVRAEVEALLRHHDSEEGAELEPLLGDAAGAAWAELAATRPPAPPGFRVRRRLGSGATGTVYEAEQESPRRRVAIKLLHVPTADGLRRFEQEARVLARLDHPGIARILAQGTEATPEGPRPYLVIELVEGVPLNLFARGVDRGSVLALLRQLCAAVAHAHERGVIHRDLKPGNILVTAKGDVKVLDFGLARPIDSASRHTRTGNVLGTLAYMSPEQAAGDPGSVDTRSDVYALGVIAYELLAGRLPLDLEGKPMPEALRMIREVEPRPLAGLGDLMWIVAKAMAKEKDRRYSNAAALLDDLARYAASEPVVARAPTAGYQLRRFVRRHRGLVGGAGATVLALVVGLVLAIAFAQEARRAETRVRHAAALAELRLASAALAAGTRAALDRHLEAVPEDERGWAWGYLAARGDTSNEAVPHECPTVCAALGGGGRLAAGAWPNGRVAALFDARTGARIDGAVPAAGACHMAACFGGGRAWFLRGVEGGMALESPDGPTLTLPGTWGTAVAADASGKFIAAGELEGHKGFVALVEIQGEKVRWRAQLGGAPVGALAFSPDGALVAAGDLDSRLAVYRVSDGQPRFVLLAGTQSVECLAFDREGRELALGSGDHSIEIRDALTGELRRRLAGHGAPVSSLAYDPATGELVSGSADMSLRVWDTRTGACTRVLLGHRTAVAAIDFEPDGRLWSLSATRVRAWPRPNPDVLRAHAGIAEGNPMPYVYGVAFHPDGTLVASCGWDGTARIFDAATRRELARFRAPREVRGVAFSPDGRWFAFARETVEVRDARTGALRGRYGEPRGGGQGRHRLLFLPDGRHLVASHYGGIERIDLESGEVLDWQPGRTGESFNARVACTPDGKLLAHEEKVGCVVLRRAEDGEVVRRWQGSAREIDALAFAPGGSVLATGGVDPVVRLWSVPDGKEIASLKGHTLSVYALAFSPDGRWLASGSDDHSIRIWDVLRGEERLVLAGHDRYVFDLAFSPDGRTLASASGDNTVRFWSTVPERERWEAARGIEQAEAALRASAPEALAAIAAAAAESASRRRAAANLLLGLGARDG